MTKLRISTTLTLPADAVTSTIVIYGGKGMGKTNLAGVLVEEFASAGQRFAVIDPMGVWWGLRHSIDGKGNGIKVLILGGTHGHLPIAPDAGALVADLVVDDDASVIIDISRRPDGSMWAIAERISFVRDYAKRIYQRQGEKRRPINQVIDEAARFAPQIVRQGELEVAACMGAIAVLVEEGRNVGIGVTLVTQRSARLNKDVAELADCMIAFRIVGPNSMRAVLDWLGKHVEKSRLKEMSERLRSLPRGSALVVSPGWLEFEGIAAMRKRTTFDSSATPETGKELRVSGTGAKIDVEKYRERFAQLIEQQKANDPKTLKARIAELEKQATAGTKAVAVGTGKTIEKAVLKDGQLARIGVLLDVGDRIVAQLTDAAVKADALFEAANNKALLHGEKLASELAKLRAVVASTKSHDVLAPNGAGQPITRREVVSVLRVGGQERRIAERPASGNRHESNGALPVGEAATLRALIQYTGGLERRQLTVITGYKRSTRDAYIARLRERGFVDVQGDCVIATAEGVAALPDAQPLPTGTALQDYWLHKLPTGEGTILAKLLEVNGEDFGRDDLTEATGFKRSTRDAYLARLAAKELVIDVGRGFVKASPTLFEVS